MTTATPTLLIAGAKSDIARAVARHYAEQGCALQLAARNPDQLQADVEDLKLRGAASVTLLELDVESPKSIEACVSNLAPFPDIAVCAVGYLGEQEQTQQNPEESQRVIAANLTGPALLFERLAERMSERRSGSLVGISSVAGDRGRASNYWYGCAKAGFSAFLSGLRQRLHRSGVQVITVKPGFVRTAMTADLDLPLLLTATPEKIAQDLASAVDRKQSVVYTPFYWRFIMMIITGIPEFLFKKVSL